jgi:hypothetical protein
VTKGGSDLKDPGVVMFQSYEDDLAETLVPRALAMDANMERIVTIPPFIIDKEGLVILREGLERHRPQLVIIDPLFAAMGAAVDIHRANQTRDVMTKLMRLAEQFGCAMLLIRHLSKGGGTTFRGLGSIDIQAAARSVLLVGAHRKHSDTRAMLQVKNNLAEFGPPQGYMLSKQNGFSWTGDSNMTVDDILGEDPH